MKSLQLPVVLRENILDITAGDLADGRLRNSGSLSDLDLGHPSADQRSNEIASFHGFVFLHAYCGESFGNMQARLNPAMPRQPLDSFASRLATARSARGLTQGELAMASGMKQPDISKMERGQIVQTTGMARIAAALRVPAQRV